MDEKQPLDPSDRDVRQRLLAAGWLGEPLISLFRFGGKDYFCWKSDNEPRPRADHGF